MNKEVKLDAEALEHAVAVCHRKARGKIDGIDPAELIRAYLSAAPQLDKQPSDVHVKAGVGQDGWVLVPVEPTPDMVAAGLRELQDNLGDMSVIDRDPLLAYRAMLAARPTPPEGGEGE